MKRRFFLLTVFITLFLGMALSVQVVSCRHTEQLSMGLISKALLLTSLALIIRYFF